MSLSQGPLALSKWAPGAPGDVEDKIPALTLGIPARRKRRDPRAWQR